MTTGDYLASVKAIGIKQLKARLSEFIRLAKAGQTVLILDRDEVVAELAPPRQLRKRGDGDEDALEDLVRSGQVTSPAIRKTRDWTWRVRGLGLPAGTVKKILDDLRSDR